MLHICRLCLWCSRRRRCSRRVQPVLAHTLPLSEQRKSFLVLRSQLRKWRAKLPSTLVVVSAIALRCRVTNRLLWQSISRATCRSTLPLCTSPPLPSGPRIYAARPSCDASGKTRGIPDISATEHGISQKWTALAIIYLASAAAPIVGSIITLINEARITAGKKPVGVPFRCCLLIRAR
jgi:hypothetical protein